jgi:type I restriction enzyme S subunit
MIQENLPSDWEYLPIRSIFTESDTRCGDNQYDLLSVTQDRGIIKQSDVDIKKDISNDDKSKYKVLLKDSIAYNKMRMWQGAVGINEIDDGIVSPAYVVINPTKEMNTKFYYYLFKTPYMISQFGKYSYGLVDDMNSLRYDDFQKIYIPIPPLEEQNKIVDFIDKKAVQIEKFIKDKTRFIELLKEQKEAVNNEAVTKGLDNTVEFKDSEIEWLGKIPKHWEIKKLKYAVIKIGDIDHYMPDSVPSGKPYIMTGDMFEKASMIDFENCKQVSEEDYLKLSRKIKPNTGDIIFARYATIGTVCYVDIEKDFLVSYACVTIKPKHQKVTGKYLFYFFKSNFFLEEIKSHINSNTQGNVGVDSLYRTRLVVPPYEEQLQIVEYIENELNQIDKLIEKTTKEIELIKEYKTSLINEAVSGKIKV